MSSGVYEEAWKNLRLYYKAVGASSNIWMMDKILEEARQRAKEYQKKLEKEQEEQRAIEEAMCPAWEVKQGRDPMKEAISDRRDLEARRL